MTYVSRRPNLLREGYEIVAAHFAAVVAERDRERYHLFVNEDGAVRWVQVACLNRGRVKPIPDAHLVGTYHRHAPIEVIEGDLIERARELTRGRRAA